MIEIIRLGFNDTVMSQTLFSRYQIISFKNAQCDLFLKFSSKDWALNCSIIIKVWWNNNTAK